MDPFDSGSMNSNERYYGMIKVRNERIHQDNVDWTNEGIGSDRPKPTPRTNINLDNRVRMWRLTCYIYNVYISVFSRFNAMQMLIKMWPNKNNGQSNHTPQYRLFQPTDETFTYLLWFNGALSSHLDLLDTY